MWLRTDSRGADAVITVNQWVSYKEGVSSAGERIAAVWALIRGVISQ